MMPDNGSELMQIEVRMLRWSDSSTAGRTATFELDPLDGIEHPLRHFASGAKNGQRFRVLIAPIADDESSALPDVQAEVAPAPSPQKTVDPSKSERAKAEYASKDNMAKAVTRSVLLCKEPTFQDWIAPNPHGYTFEPHEREKHAKDALLERLEIVTRSMIGTDDEAFRAFLDVEYQFAVYQGREPEPR